MPEQLISYEEPRGQESTTSVSSDKPCASVTELLAYPLDDNIPG